MSLSSRLTKALLGVTVAAAAVVIPAAAASAATPCEGNCVTRTDTAVGGRSASVFAWTTVATRADVTIYAANATGIKAHVVDDVYKTFHALNTLTTLTPGTDYTYSLLIYDRAGHAQWRLGSFTTKHRLLTVTIGEIRVDNDGDNVGPGEETFYARAGATTLANPLYSDKSIGSGSSVYPNRKIMSIDPAYLAPITVEMVDADCSFCTYGLGPDWGTGSSSEKDWVTAWKFVDTSVPTNGPVRFVATNKGPAGITVWGNYQVSYVS